MLPTPSLPRALLPMLVLTPLLCAWLLLGSAAGQSEPPVDHTFEERTRVFEVQVPVNVTDRHGLPIRDLQALDFVILDQGQVQEITGFQVVDLDEFKPQDDRVMEVDYHIPAAARRHFLLLFDLSFSSPTTLVRARRAASEFVLEEMHPSDLAAVAVHTVESGTQLLVTFTPDRAQLARAITTMGNPRLLHMTTRDPLRFMLDTPDTAAATISRDVGGVSEEVRNLENSVSAYLQIIGKQMAKIEKSYARGQISSWTRSMGEMARILGSVEGRKHVVWFSEGFDGRLLLGRQPDAFDEEMHEETRNIENGDYFLVDTDDRYGNTQLQSDMTLMLNEFRRANCVIQAVDISGLRADLPAEDRVRRVGRDALFYVANETGGKLYEDANDFGEELVKVLETSTVTYLLSFRPSQIGEPGEHRELKVRLQGGGAVKISHRMGYFVPRDFDELHPMEKSLLASDLIASATVKDDLDIGVLAAAFRATDAEAYVPVIIEIGGAGLLAGHEGPKLPVELYAYATNQHGEMKDFFTQLVTLDLETRRESFADTGLKYYGHLSLGPGDYLVRVLVRNSKTGLTGVRTASVEIPQYAQRGPQLLPPFFLEPPGSWFLVRETDAARNSGSTVYPFTVNGEPYIPAAAPLLAPHGHADLCLVAYNLGRGRIDLEAQVLGADGEPVPGGRLALRERTVTGIDGLDKLVATFEPAGLLAGSYTLEVAVTDPETQARRVNSIPLRVLE